MRAIFNPISLGSPLPACLAADGPTLVASSPGRSLTRDSHWHRATDCGTRAKLLMITHYHKQITKYYQDDSPDLAGLDQLGPTFASFLDTLSEIRCP